MDIFCFEKHYSGHPDAVEFSVRYDNKPYLHDKSIIGYITLQHCDDIIIPITQLDWLINCLSRIKMEIIQGGE